MPLVEKLDDLNAMESWGLLQRLSPNFNLTFFHNCQSQMIAIIIATG